MAVFGVTAKQWREVNLELAKQGKNIRDMADIIQLNVLANIESLNSVLIGQKVDKSQRFEILSNTAISQFKRLSAHKNLGLME